MIDKDFERMQHLHVLKSMCFQDSALYSWRFENDNGKNPLIARARIYVSKWSDMFSKNIGLLLWGDVGTGKSFFAACIANALVENNTTVRMTNFSAILNDLFTETDKNAYIGRLNNHDLLIIDDLGIERSTEYALEQVYNIIDARYKSNKPLIVTTNLSLAELKNSTDTIRKRIHDRVLEMCVPIKFGGKNFRAEKAKIKLKQAAELLGKEAK